VKHTLLVMAAGLAVIAIAGIVIGHAVTGPFSTVISNDVDSPVRNFVTDSHPQSWHDLLAHVSAFGTALVTGAIAAVVGVLWSLRRGSLTTALQCAAAFGGAGALTIIVKYGVNRQPASGPLPSFSAGSFPSGHALFAVSVYGTIAALVVRSHASRALRLPVAVLLAVLALTVGWSRVYLLDHFASDVLGSLVLGLAWVAVVVRADSPTRTRS
jgi:membrane-associated phospholipid phosphatase